MLQWFIKNFIGSKTDRDIRRMRPLVAAINAREPALEKLSDEDLRAWTPKLKERVKNGESLDKVLVDAFAVCREASRRVLGMRHYDVQLIGGMVLHRGSIAEMRTGEGKTLVATLPCYLNALAGKGVHVITVNDYLARRDCEWMGRIYHFLGMTTGVIVGNQEDDEKRASYKADITYGQNNEFGFDYLRDNMKYSSLDYYQRELNFAIVDEVDSILIDEARTPLIISGQGETASQKYKTINNIIPKLKKDQHYVVDEKANSVTLTDDGVDMAQQLLEVENLFEAEQLETIHILNQCLRAHTLFQRDVNYMVSRDGKVLIIDEFTGRVLPGRRWSDGLHQAVEAKENVRIQEENRTMATISFQNLFRLYNKLAGMTGTALTEAAEFHKVYKLDVLPIPTNKDIIRVDHQDVVYKTEKEKFSAVFDEIMEYHDRGQPILVGTVSVEKSNAISRLLEKKGIKHEVLNAKHHENEAYIVAQAGRRGAITVSTNMAGRGTDIILGGNPEMMAKAEFMAAERYSELDSEAFKQRVEELKEQCKNEHDEVVGLGGLHIVGTERHESRRIDNQLRGRAGRQGDPGSSRFYLSLDDELMRIFGGDNIKWMMEQLGMPDNEPIVHPSVTNSIETAQTKVEARNFDIRQHMLEYDDVMNQQRRNIYILRRDLLDGIYAPEELDDRGKPTGIKREIETSKTISDSTKSDVEAIFLKHSLIEGSEEQPAEKIELVAKVRDFEAFRQDIYRDYGVRFFDTDFEEMSGVEFFEAIANRVARSLTEQRERLLDLIEAIISDVLSETCSENVPPEDWDWKEITKAMSEHFAVEITDDEADSYASIEKLAIDLYARAKKKFEEREKDIGDALILRIFRSIYLEEIDRAWVEHLTNMEHLRDGIGLRGYGQQDPKQAYKLEGYEIFVNMTKAIAGAVAQKTWRAEIRRDNAEERAREFEAHQLAELQRQLSMIARHPTAAVEDEAPPETPEQIERALARAKLKQMQAVLEQQVRASEAASAPKSARELPAPEPPQPVVNMDDPCPCGSGESFKSCHGAYL